jgi:hypothetical protein
MKAGNANKIMSLITDARLSSYKETDIDCIDILIQRYLFNIEVCEAFYPILSLFEITLRNSICNTIDKVITKDFLLQEANRRNILTENDHKNLLKTVERLKNNGMKITNDRLVSEMTLGFWIHLCTKNYKTKLWDKKGFFESVFPNYKPVNQLKSIGMLQNELLKVLKLRNRIFHHEIIINSKISLKDYYNLIRDLLYLMSNDMVELLDSLNRIEIISRQKP